MAKVLRGRFKIKLDQKGRISLPVSIRQALQSNKSKNLELVFTNNLYQKNRFLDVYPLKQWEELEKNISKLPQLKAEVQAYKRFYLAAAQVVNSDNQHRFLIPQDLRSYAGLKESSEMVLVGMSDKLEIWPTNTWQKLDQTLVENFEDILESVAELAEKK